MSGIDDLNFEDLVDGAINTIDDARTERYDAQKLIQPKAKAQPSVVVDVTLETPAPLRSRSRPANAPMPPGPTATFEHIYGRAGVEDGDFTIFRLEELYNDPDLGALDASGRVAAVRAILKSHGVDLDEIVGDAVARRTALHSHDRRLKSNIERVDSEMEQENAQLQAEIEQYANPRIDKMEKNAERVERLHRDYLDWYDRMRAEEHRLASILEPWGGDPRLSVSEQSFKPDTLVEQAVSGEEAFEPEEPQQDAPTREAEIFVPEDARSWAEEDVSELGRASSAAFEEPALEVDEDSELEFGPVKMRVPRTFGQWLVMAVTIAVWAFGALLLAAQLSQIETPGVLVLTFAWPPVVAILLGLATRRRSFWSGPVVIWLLLSIASVAAAHYDPANLVQNLTKRPLWFVDEAGLSSDIENATYAVTGPYAATVAPLLGVSDAIWTAPEATTPAKK